MKKWFVFVVSCVFAASAFAQEEMSWVESDAEFLESYQYPYDVYPMDDVHDPLPPPPAPPTDNPPPRPPSRPPTTPPGNPPQPPAGGGPTDPFPPNPNPPPPRNEVPYYLGGGELGRFRTREYDFYPRADLNRLVRLRLSGFRNSIEIKEVVVQFADNGSEQKVYVLHGDIEPGRMKEAFASGRPIHRIRVRASANGVFKKPGGFRLDVIAVR